MNRKFQLLITGLIICGVNFIASASDSNKVCWGIKVTGDAEFPSKWHGQYNSVKMFHNGSGFTIGGVSNIYIGKNFYFEPGVSFFYSNYKYDLVVAYLTSENPKLTKYGLEVPTVFGYKIDFSDRIGLRIFTGPQIRYAFGGKIGIKDSQFEDSQSIEETKNLLLWDTNRRFDCSWKVGVGLPIDRFMISVEADFGLTNLYKTSTLMGSSKWRYRENRVGAGLTYYF